MSADRDRAIALVKMSAGLPVDMSDSELVRHLEAVCALPLVEPHVAAEAAALLVPVTGSPLAAAGSAPKPDAAMPRWAQIGTAATLPGPPLAGGLAAHAEQAATDAGLPPDASVFPGRGNLGVS